MRASQRAGSDGSFGTRDGHYVVRNTQAGDVVFRTTDKQAAFAQRNALNDAARPPSTREFVSAAATRRRIRQLQRAGVGMRTIALRAGLERKTVVLIFNGESRRIRRSTALAIDGVSAVPRGATTIGAGPTWQLLDAILAVGYTKTEIAKALGYKRPALQMKRTRVSAIAAARVQRLYAHVWRNDARLRRLVDPLAEIQRAGGAPTTPRERLAAALRGMDPTEFASRLSRYSELVDVA